LYAEAEVVTKIEKCTDGKIKKEIKFFMQVPARKPDGIYISVKEC
jgi:hypothetical protein